MIIPDLARLLYLICTFGIVIAVIIISAVLSRKTFKLKYYVLSPMIIGVFTIVFYCLFLMAEDYKLAVLFESLFFVGTDWLALFMMYFAIYYTELNNGKTYFIKIIFAFFVIADSISLLLNNIRFHMFQLIPLGNRFGMELYWGNEFYFLHYCHLFLCYIMVSTCLICLITASIKVSELYKAKYYTVLIAYVVVIVVNFISYTNNLPIDLSVFLYGVLGGFISYYATVGFPKRLLDISLFSVNDTISDAVIYFDYFGKCIYANKKAQEIFSNEGEFIADLTETYMERWADQLCFNERSVTGTDSFYDNGTETYYEVVYQREYSKNSEIGSSLKLYDKTEEVRSYEMERNIAIHDSLTGSYNRTGFFEAVDELVEKNGTSGWILLASNIKNFQLINEYFGEQRGDEVLKRQAMLCQNNSHKETIFGRINDDRFALYTKKEYFSEKDFMKFISIMAELTDCPYYKMKIVIGVYDPEGKAEKAQVMYDKAVLSSEYSNYEYDKVFSYYDSVMMGKVYSDRRLSDSLDDALKNKEVEMYLQPIMNRKGECVGAEALSRWHSAHFGDMMPEQFISVLEKTGQIYLLDAYIWEETAKLLQKWSSQGKSDIFITVNISIKDFFYADLYEIFMGLITKYNINPKTLRVEITETVLTSDFKKVFDLVEKLRSEGIKVAIDNFGNGYSSLNMLKDFQSDCLKIDMDLLKNAETEDRNKIIINSIVEMSKDLGMSSIGSGVETKAQYDVLKKCKCEYFQGNYISAPVSVAEFELKYNN